MSSRSSFRQKMVLAVMVVRHGGHEKQLAHTMDLTEVSARLGGIVSPLEPGEIIEIERGAVKAEFRVVWMGDPRSALAHQAGIHIVRPQKFTWNIELKTDQVEVPVDIDHLRHFERLPLQEQAREERRWHQRYVCSGTAAIKTDGASFEIFGEVKDISEGGIYVEVAAPLPVNSKVNLKLCIENISFTATGVVRTSYPLLGMGIHFQDVTRESLEKLAVVVERAKRRRPQEQCTNPELLQMEQSSSEEADQEAVIHEWSPNPEGDCAPISVLTAASQEILSDFDRWRRASSPAEVAKLRLAIDQLHEKLDAAT
ncbi:MAG: hypothetical protein DMG65_03500 [Candidatus Angelobacter sp. Gp1-AA117]|nr:MAG: hypothetical protein DMG65_03500 [Candidatus Angelobacter sp. Gp1-AA117]